MPDLAKQFTKKEIETALDYILENEIELISSTKHNLIYKDHLFPPKEVVRWAAKLKNDRDYSNYRLSGGENTNKPLRELGFEIVQKDNLNSNDQTVNQKIISQYKARIKERGNKDELYKFQLIHDFQTKWDIDAVDFSKMFLSIDFKNLIYHQIALTSLRSIATRDPEFLREKIRFLFNEEEGLLNRISIFCSDLNSLYLSWNPTLQGGIDERTVATLLTLNDPSKYTFYKWTFYNEWCKVLGIKVAKTGESYFDYLEKVDDLIYNYIIDDHELLAIHESYLNDIHFKDKDYFILAQDIIYQVLEKSKNKNVSENKNYWLYQPGEDARFWEEFYEHSIIGLGWDYLGDLGQYVSKNEIADQLRKLEKSSSSKKNDATANWDFYKTMQVGDIVIVKKGRRKLLGFGEVISDYNYDTNRSEYTSVRKMKWIKKGEWTVSFDLVLKTLTDITKYDSEVSKGQKYFEFLLSIMNTEQNYKEQFRNWLVNKTSDTSNRVGSYMRAIEILDELVSLKIFEMNDLKFLGDLYQDLIKEQRKEDGKYYYEKSPSYGNNGYFSAAIREYMDFHKELLNIMNTSEHNLVSLNQILYGPPGTGKTYNTINKAVAIANPTFDLNQDRAVVKAEYHRLVDSGQIVFTTFHQSMSYEDFVEGIKPIIDEDGDGNKQVVYEVQDGIFKQIVEASKKIKIVTNEKQEIYSFDDAWNELIEHVRQEVYDAMNEFSLEILTPNKSLKVIEITDKGNLRIKPESVDSLTYTVSYARTKKLHEAFPDLAVVSNIDKEFRSVIGGSNSTAYWAVLNYINKKIVENNSASTSTIELPKETHVLIIDEINRGNVSAIFGELITLIEDTKREGSDEALQVTLPYSKQKFSVPANLYIIGTMNTADRSVEALDTALRRRFVFEEMSPIPELLKQDLYGLAASAILQRINQRIEKLIDRDHCIGHAYFIGKNESTIIDSFYKNIIPLLQEYFFGDYGKIGLVLGKGFVRLKKEEGNVFADFDYDYVDDLANKPIYEIIDYRTNQEVNLSFEKAIHDLMR